jgi:hypothetical protein
MGQIFLHIGTLKTGTTSFQRWFFDNQDAIARDAGVRWYNGQFPDAREIAALCLDPQLWHLGFSLLKIQVNGKSGQQIFASTSLRNYRSIPPFSFHAKGFASCAVQRKSVALQNSFRLTTPRSFSLCETNEIFSPHGKNISEMISFG